MFDTSNSINRQCADSNLSLGHTDYRARLHALPVVGDDDLQIIKASIMQRMLVRARSRTGETSAPNPKLPRIYADLHRLFAFDP